MKRAAPCDRRPVRFFLLGVASISLISGCTSSLLDTELPPTSIYVLAPAASERASTAAPLPVDISIGRPDVSPGLDTNRIAVLKGRQLDYYRAARWGGSLTEVVQTLLVNSLEDRRLFRSVTAEQARVAGDYVLDVEVRDFQAEYTNDNAAPTVRVKMIGRLIRIADRELVASLSAETQSTASADRMHAVAAAFETSAQKVAIDLAQKAAAAIASDVSKLSAARGNGKLGQ